MTEVSGIVPIKPRFGPSFIYTPSRVCESLNPTVVESLLLLALGFRSKSNLPDILSVGQGSFSSVWVHDGICLRFTPVKVSDVALTRVLETMHVVTEKGLSCRIYSFGKVTKEPNGELIGIAVVMEKLTVLPHDFAAEEKIWDAMSSISAIGFHNDFKLDNLMVSAEGRLAVIDFDFLDSTTLVVPVTDFQSLRLDLSQFLNSLGNSSAVRLFRAFYDYTYLSASVSRDHPLYTRVLGRLRELFNTLEIPVLRPLLQFLGHERERDIPIEVLVRCPAIEAVSLNIFDLAGNAFAHGIEDWNTFPTLLKSNGVYWPS